MNKEALTPKQKEVLSLIRKTEIEGQFTAAEFSTACGQRVVAQTLNALADRGFVKKIEGTSPIKYSKVGSDITEQTISILEMPVTKIIKEGDIVDKLFSLDATIAEDIDRILNFMKGDTYATEPGTQIGIYKIVDVADEKVIYVGKTERPFAKRWTEHKELLAAGHHHSSKLQEHFDGLGRDFTKVKFEILQELPFDPKLIDLRERFWIDKHKDTILNHMKPKLIK